MENPRSDTARGQFVAADKHIDHDLTDEEVDAAFEMIVAQIDAEQKTPE